MILLLVLTYAFRPAPAQQAIGSPSSYSPEWLGTKAAFLLLQQSGFRVERWISPPAELPEDVAGTTLIFAEPSEKPSSGDRAAVARFVSAGGRLLVMGASGAAFAPQSSSIAIPDSNLTPKVYPALLPSPLSRDAPEITMVAPDKWSTLPPGQLAIYGKEGEPVVVWYRFGKGQVIWWAISSPMSNGSLREKGNLAMFLNSVDPPVSRVLWDEYFVRCQDAVALGWLANRHRPSGRTLYVLAAPGTRPHACGGVAALASGICEYPRRTLSIGACRLGSGGRQLSAAATVAFSQAGDSSVGEAF
jgi:hypothetical protein